MTFRRLCMRSVVMKRRFGNKNASAGENNVRNFDALSRTGNGYVIFALRLHISTQHTHMYQTAYC